MSISILNHKSAKLTNNASLMFNDTSFDLNDSMNLFVISDYVLSDLACTLENSSESISLYSFDIRKYQIIVRGTCNESGDVDFQGLEFSVVNGQSASTVADSLISVLTDYSNIVKTVLSDHVLIEFENSVIGVSVDNLIDDDLSVFGLIFDISVLNGGNAIQTVSALTLNNVQQFQQSNKYIYKLNLLFRPQSEAGEHVDDYLYKHAATVNIHTVANLVISDFTFSLTGYGIAQNDKYIIALQNFKQFVTNDYYTAFMQSDYNEALPNNQLLNAKRQEYLLNILDLTGFIGAYRSLLSAIKYFGYGELLTLKELWINVYGEYKHTDIANAVLPYIDKALVGFDKTNQMSLVYQINTEKADNPQFDSDGLEYYVNILYNTDEILTKLHALKNILERDFMPLNTKIVDIVGEYKSILGIDTIIWETAICTTDYNLTENINSDVEIVIDKQTIDILNHKCLIRPWSVIADNSTVNDDLKFIDNITTAFHTSTFFEIDSLISVDDDFAEDFDIATRFISEDFGYIRCNVEMSNVSAFYEYIVILYKSGVEKLRLPRRPISYLVDNGIQIAVKELGNYDLTVVLFDNYGGSVIAGIDDIIVQNRYTDFKLYRTINTGNTAYEKDIKLTTTYQTNASTGLVQIDPLDEGLAHILPSPNLTWDPFTGIDRVTSNQHLISKHFKTDITNSSTRKKLTELAGLALFEMPNVNISSLGYSYGTWLIDILGSGGYGRRSIEMKLFENQAFNKVDLIYSSGSVLDYLQQCISILSSTGDAYAYFTYSINHFSVDDTISNVRPMIRMTAKQPSFTSSNVIFQVTNAFTPLFENSYVYDTIESVLPMSVGFELYYNNTTAIRQLTITYDNISISQNIAFLSKADMITKLNAIFAENNFNIVIFDNNGSTVFVTSDKDLYLSHDAIGINADICRGNFSNKLYQFIPGDDLILGETVYAMVDENSKIDNRDILWTLSDSLTGAILDQQNSYMFRTVLLSKRSYTLKLETSDPYGSNARVKNGCMLIN